MVLIRKVFKDKANCTEYKMYVRRPRSTRTRKKRYAGKRSVSARQVATIARRVFKKSSETKQQLMSDGSPSAALLYHNQDHLMFNGFNLLDTHHGTLDDAIGFSGANGSRIGDEIFPTGLKIKFLFQTPPDRANIYIRFLLLKGHDSYLDSTLPWHVNSLAFPNVLLNNVDTDKVKVVMNKVWKIGSDAKDARTTSAAIVINNVCQPRKIYCDLRKLGRYTYRHDGTTVTHGKHYDIKGYLCAYDEFGSLITDNICTYTAQSTFYFKDNC